MRPANGVTFLSRVGWKRPNDRRPRRPPEHEEVSDERHDPARRLGVAHDALYAWKSPVKKPGERRA